MLLLSGTVFGIVSARHIAIPNQACLLAGIFALGLAWHSHKNFKQFVAFAMLITAGTSLGVGFAMRAHDGMASAPINTLVQRGDDVSVSGTLVEDPDNQQYSVKVLIRNVVVTDQHIRQSLHRTILIRVSGTASTQWRVLEAGDRISFVGSFEELDPSDQRYYWKHAVAMCRARELVDFSAGNNALDRIANRLRNTINSGMDGLGPQDRALLSGFLLGDTRGVDDNTKIAFRNAGLSHLLAVSGENVAFVLALVQPLLKRLSLLPRFISGLSVLVIFGAMTRWEPSVLRASVMAAIVMFAYFIGRPTIGLRSLSIAVTLLLWCDPFLLHSVGFLLSCGASAGIALLMQPIARHIPGPYWVRDSLAVTLAAQIGVAPIMLTQFGSIPFAALPANLLAVPAAGPITTWGLFICLFAGLFKSSFPVITLGQRPTALLLEWVRLVARTCASIPIVLTPKEGALLALCTVAIFGRRMRKQPRDALALEHGRASN